MISSNINQAILSEIIGRIRKGEINYCKQMGFSEEELCIINNLNTHEIYDLCESIVPFVKIKIDHQIFWNLINSVREHTKERNLIDRALELGISGDMLRERFAWSSAEVSARRKLLGIKEHIGRKKNASEADELKIWENWQRYKPKEKDIHVFMKSPEGLDLLIFITEDTGVNLTEVWRLISSWLKKEE